MRVPDALTLARLEEARAARALAALGLTSVPIGGGLMIRGTPGQWLNKGVALGMDRPVDSAEIASLVGFYESVGIEPRIETCPLADESLTRHLAEAGFVVRRYGHMLVRPLADLSVSALPAGVRVHVVDPADQAALAVFATTVHAGFVGKPPTRTDLDMWERAAGHAGTTSLHATVEGRPAAAGCVQIVGPHAALFGLSVLPEFRKRGIQSALFVERMRLARQHGAEFATVGSAPLGPTERNARRLGFELGYAQATLVRPGPGLVTVK